MIKVPIDPSIDYIKNHDILEELYLERIRQHTLWGLQTHHMAIWNCILGEEVGEVAKAINEWIFNGKKEKDIRDELIQVAAVAIAMIESLDKNGAEGKKSENN